MGRKRIKRRPQLKPGDLCRLSKPIGSYGRNIKSIVVESANGDTTDGFTKVRCIVVFRHAGSTHWGRYTYNRRELWYTGYNVNTKAHSPQPMHDEPTVKIDRQPKPSNPTKDAVEKICVCWKWENRTVWDPCICGAMKK